MILLRSSRRSAILGAIIALPFGCHHTAEVPALPTQSAMLYPGIPARNQASMRPELVQRQLPQKHQYEKLAENKTPTLNQAGGIDLPAETITTVDLGIA